MLQRYIYIYTQIDRGGLTCLPPGDFPDPGIEPTSLMSPALADGFFTTNTTWEAYTDTDTHTDAHTHVSRYM